MDLVSDDYYSLADEKFDFDTASLSPASSRGDEEEEEDEVFEAGRAERSKALSSREEPRWGPLLGEEPRSGPLQGEEPHSGPLLGEEPRSGPLLGEDFESIRTEAHLLANWLQDSRPEEMGGGGGGGGGGGEKGESSLQRCTEEEQFVRDPQDKLGVLRLPPPGSPLSPIKRETFCVQDSPLPPALRPRPPPPATAAPRTHLGPSGPTRPLTRTQTRGSLRGKTGLLPNKLPPPGSLSCSRRSERAEPPGRGAPGRPSPRGSCEDLLSDTASVASDASDCSLNSSIRVLPPGKAPPTHTRKGVETRRHTSSSSLSSFNSSVSVSPAAQGKLNSSVSASRTRRSTLSGRAADPAAATAGPVSAQLRRPALVGRSTPVKRAEPSTPLALTPAKRLMDRPSSSRPSLTSSSKPSLASCSKLSLTSSSKPSLTSSSKPSLTSSSKLSLKAQSKPNLTSCSKPSLASCSRQPGSRAKPGAPVVAVAATPTHLRRLAGPEGVPSPDATRIMKSKRLQVSTCSVDSAPHRAPGVEQPATPSSPSPPSVLQWRRSALPTPRGRRLSSIPTMTPRPRPATPRLSPSGPEQRWASVIPPFSLEEPAPRGSTSPPPPRGPGETRQEEKEDLIQLLSAEDTPTAAEDTPTAAEDTPTAAEDMPTAAEDMPTAAEDMPTAANKKQENMEVLLVDLPAPVLRVAEKLLIDLSNTPDVLRTSKPCGGQLIDLSSPLIKWSPEEKKEKKENPGLLINLSF